MLLSEQTLLPEQLAGALNLQMESGRQLGAILVEQGLLDARALTQALATQLGLPTVDLRTVRPTAEALALVSEEWPAGCSIVPLRLADGVLDVAISDGSSDAGARSAGPPRRRRRQHLPRARRRRDDVAQHATTAC